MQAALNATTAPAPLTKCDAALGPLCGANRSSGGADGCEFCAGQHSAPLFEAGCTLETIAEFCHGTPAAPTEVASTEAPEQLALWVGRLKVAELSTYYVALIRWKELLSYANAHRLDWPFGPSFAGAWAEFASTWTRIGATMAMEGGFGLDAIQKETQEAQKPWQAVSCPPTCPCGD